MTEQFYEDDSVRIKKTAKEEWVQSEFREQERYRRNYYGTIFLEILLDKMQQKERVLYIETVKAPRVVRIKRRKMMDTLLECKDLTKKFGNKTAIDHIDLSIESGHIIGLLGPNGSGKTTLIKMINGLLTPTSGTLYYKENPIGVESKRHISYLPDHTYLNMNQRVKEVIAFFQDFYEDFDRERAYDMLQKLNINPNDSLKSMSKGTKEKVQLILVMSRKAELYILDEPIAGVDPAARDYILDVILTNYDPSASILISTHLIADIENILDQVVFIQNGQIRLSSSVDDIRAEEGKSIDALFREVFRC